jgi:cell division septation protein DedD
MNRITTFQVPLRAEELRPSDFAGAAVTPLAETMQALVTAVSRRAADAPVTLYFCADDDSTRARDDFAMALARTLTAHVPSTLLVDCDFLHPGLSEQMPQKDALGFLDYLLYGSSIGVITQDHDGAHLVGAGSFPVTKRMPVAESAFADAAKRLVTHARCAIFVGPVFDGDGGRHPLAGLVDVVATLRTTARDARLDAAEEHIAAGAEVWSIRLGGAPVPEPVEAKPPAVAPPAFARPVPKLVPLDAMSDERPGSSLVPRIAVIAFGLLVIAFVVWWFMQNHGQLNKAQVKEKPRGAVAPDSLQHQPDTLATRDTLSMASPFVAAPARRDTTARTPLRTGTPQTANRGTPVVRKPADTAGHTGGTMLVNSSDIQVMEDLDRKFHGWYMIHISSFQTSVRARDEVAFLESREFPVFIVFLDLGAKGKWYRVYAGPFETRAEANDVKKNLDAVPQVRFTRVATIPD